MLKVKYEKEKIMATLSTPPTLHNQNSRSTKYGPKNHLYNSRPEKILQGAQYIPDNTQVMLQQHDFVELVPTTCSARLSRQD